MNSNFQLFDEIEPSSGGMVILVDRVRSVKTPIRINSAIHGGSDLEGWHVTIVADGGGLFRPRATFSNLSDADAWAISAIKTSNASYGAG